MTLQRALLVSAPWVSATHLVGCQVDCWSNPRRSASRMRFFHMFSPSELDNPKKGTKIFFQPSLQSDCSHPVVFCFCCFLYRKWYCWWNKSGENPSWGWYLKFHYRYRVLAPSKRWLGMEFWIINSLTVCCQSNLFNCEEVPWWQIAPQRYSTALASLGLGNDASVDELGGCIGLGQMYTNVSPGNQWLNDQGSRINHDLKHSIYLTKSYYLQ